MHLNQETAEHFVGVALEATLQGSSKNLAALPAPIYVTDELGFVTYFNEACVVFAGRVPVIGRDRWCVTWRLLTYEGKALPHDQCPMAQAIRQKRPLRGAVAIAIRPDRARRTFSPFPTPLLNKTGTLLGAVNVLLDLTREREIIDLRRKAKECRQWAAAATNPQTANAFNRLAEEQETKAETLDRLNKLDAGPFLRS
ncbi:MAG: hypothetical protein ABWZ40_14585 [Caulobacterales bacterium]